MKKVLVYIGTVILSLLIVLLVFQLLSWYNFGDIPTRVVLIRMLGCFCALEGIQLCVIALIKKRKI